jgi:hypothetical protein
VTAARSTTYVAMVSIVIASAVREAQKPVAFSVGAPRSVGASRRATCNSASATVSRLRTMKAATKRENNPGR